MGFNIKYKTGLAIVALSVFALFGLAVDARAEKIINFDASIKVNADSSINVVEKIKYDFGNIEKHGIYRDIETQGKIKVSNVSVVDERGKPYELEIAKSGDTQSIKIGSANLTISGIHTYVISYSVNGAIGYFDNFDEIYWNATGDGWAVPIESAVATVTLPQVIQESYVRQACYAGSRGATTPCKFAGYIANSLDQVSAFNFSQNNLSAGEGLTVAVGFPKDIVSIPPPTFLERNPSVRFLVFLLPILIFCLMFWRWNKVGRDPKGRGVIIPQYDAPKGLTPLEVSAIMRQRISNSDISAEIVYLATRGFIKITKTTDKGLIFSSDDYIFKQLRNDLSSLEDPIDKKIMTSLMAGADSGLSEIKLSGLKNVFYTSIPSIKYEAYDFLIENGYIKSNPEKIITKYIVSSFLATAAALGGLIWAGVSWDLDEVFVGLSSVSVILSGVVAIIFSILMPAKTIKGQESKEYILGLKEYLQIAEKDRIAFHNAPEKKPEVFEKLLPYAMVLGVDKAWAKEFKDIYTTPPSWYSDSSGGAFNSILFINSLNSFNSAATSSLGSSPGGGSSGGGFSGGGMGGGGGGSW